MAADFVVASDCPAGSRPEATSDLPLPTVETVVATWGLGRLLTETLAAMAEAAPIATEPRTAYLQARALKRAWRALMRAQVEAKCGVLPGLFRNDDERMSPAAVCRELAERALSPDEAATALCFTAGLSNALRAILHAARATARDDAVAQIAEAMCALRTAIEVREAVAFPVQDEDAAAGGRLPAGESPVAAQETGRVGESQAP